jgi:hypothetical protein
MARGDDNMSDVDDRNYYVCVEKIIQLPHQQQQTYGISRAEQCHARMFVVEAL